MELTRNGTVFVLCGLDYCGSQTGDRNGMAMGATALLAIAIFMPGGAPTRVWPHYMLNKRGRAALFYRQAGKLWQ